MNDVPPREKAAEIINTALGNLKLVASAPFDLDQVVAAAQAQAQLAIASALLAISDAIETGGERQAEVLRRGLGGYTS